MKFCPPALLVAVLLSLVIPTQAQTPATDEASEQFFRGFLLKNDAEKMEADGNFSGALSLYQQMQQIFDGVAQSSPDWQPAMLNNRRSLNQQAISRLQAKLSQPAAATTAPAPAPAAAATLPILSGLNSAPGGATAAPAMSGSLPSLAETLGQWELAYRQRMTMLESQNSQQQQDLVKWQEWYNWASGEITTAQNDKKNLEAQTAKLEEAIQAMKMEVAAGRTSQQQLDLLTQEKIGIEVEYKKAVQRIAAAENASKQASQKLAEASTRISELETERKKVMAERDSAVKERDAVKAEQSAMTGRLETITKERDALSVQSLGVKAELEALKKAKPLTNSEEVKKMLAENERLKSELDTAQKQIVTLKADATRKDQEIATLRGQLTTLQGELATLRQQSSTYQTQVAELTIQLKELQEARPDMTPELALENTTLREIVMRQLRAQYRQQQAKDLVISELQKMEGVSKKLLEQVEELRNSRLTLTADEEKLFSDPALREMLGNDGIQGTLIARVSKPENASMNPKGAASTVETILEQASEAFNRQDFGKAASIYEDALRADPKNTTALVGLGYSREREKKYSEAEAALKKCLVYDPNNETAAFHLGVIYFKQDLWNDAMIYFEKNLSLNAKNARSRHYLGIIATKLNFLDRAEREFKTAIAIDPAYGEAHFNLAVLYATWDPPQWDKAKSEYDQAIKKGVTPDANLEKLLKADN